MDSHGPATLRDFAWWSGLTVKDAAADSYGEFLNQRAELTVV